MDLLMEDRLKVLTPCLSSDLVSIEAWSHLYKISKFLPTTSYGVLECRLGTATSRVDLSVCLSKGKINLPKSRLIHPAWQCFYALCQDLVDVNSSLHESIDEIWLEFDVDEESLKLPIPCILLGLNHKNNSNFPFLLDTALKLIDAPISPYLRSNVHLCFSALPTGAKIISIGAMLSRQSDAVRVIVNRINPKGLSAYLSDIGLEVYANELENIINNIFCFTDNIILSFDVGDKIFPRIGLECYVLNAHGNEPRWQLFLQYLVANGLCIPAKCNALLAWPEYDRKAWNFFKNFTTFIKIVYQPGIPLEAKAYLGFGHN